MVGRMAWTSMEVWRHSSMEASYLPYSRAARLPYLLMALLSLSGCGSGASGPKLVSFAFSEKATVPVAIEGRLEPGTLSQKTGQPTEFTLREEASARIIRVTVPSGVTVPANITSSYAVTVTGLYDPAQRKFVASGVETRVPTREQQH